MFEIGVVTQFEAAHRLHGEFGPATRTHGHTYRVEIGLRGETLKPDGTLYDIGRLQGVVRDTVEPLHYRDLDEIEGFQGKNTTAEVVARFLWQQIAPHLTGAGLDALSVRVWESPQAWAMYEGPLAPST